ncbi:hypothetical protein IG631_07149 [Alternaria alternata]|nr:hypothetical protein IG631_07149 [Alternaria alternata]
MPGLPTSFGFATTSAGRQQRHGELVKVSCRLSLAVPGSRTFSLRPSVLTRSTGWTANQLSRNRMPRCTMQGSGILGQRYELASDPEICSSTLSASPRPVIRRGQLEPHYSTSGTTRSTVSRTRLQPGLRLWAI